MTTQQLSLRVQETYPDAYVDLLGENWVIYENSNQVILAVGKTVKDAWKKLFDKTFPDEAATDSTDSYF